MTATRMSAEALAIAMASLRGRLRARGLFVRATKSGPVTQGHGKVVIPERLRGRYGRLGQ